MIIIDFEWNRSYDKIPLEEILQIGAVKIDRMGGPILDTFSVFIHPCVHKKFNRTAKALPELQASLESDLDFAAALSAFLDWCGDDRVFADWGGDDFEVLRQNCSYWHLPIPEADQLIDLQAAFSLRVGTNQGVALYRAAEYCGIPTPFCFHNALNDCVYTAMVTAWLNEDTMALLALPKEIRRLMDSPPFPARPAYPVGPFTSVQSALNSRSCRRQACPLCGESIWVRRWYGSEPGSYYADLRCKNHGSFLTYLTLSEQEDGQWQGTLSLPEVTPVLLQTFDAAIRSGAIPCKVKNHHKSHRHWTGRRVSAKKSTKQPGGA